VLEKIKIWLSQPASKRFIVAAILFFGGVLAACIGFAVVTLHDQTKQFTQRCQSSNGVPIKTRDYVLVCVKSDAVLEKLER
jgi:hypothetical protein